jgi:regulator of protease activity HflC (stomatin/prohibitin superfamily)
VPFVDSVAALEIADYRQALLRVAQTSLREMIGASPLSALLSERKAADLTRKEEIGRKTADWGVSAVSVEIPDVAIPAQLQDAMRGATILIPTGMVDAMNVAGVMGLVGSAASS